MIKIRLTRIGRKAQPQYRIVVAEARSKRDSRFADTIGYYNPLAGDKYEFKVDTAKYQEWLKKGAQPTDTVRKLFKQNSSK